LLLSWLAAGASGVSPRSEVAELRADVPGGRERRTLRHDPAIQTGREELLMAKKAKGGKKKAAKKR